MLRYSFAEPLGDFGISKRFFFSSVHFNFDESNEQKIFPLVQLNRLTLPSRPRVSHYAIELRPDWAIRCRPVRKFFSPILSVHR
mmetsp:Transcript_14406/g.29474  ORF Transcript_14406/g.29474 Transcript_14406/m.29474 type:complete len:84 (+) Transcript_14406:658-909(+)